MKISKLLYIATIKASTAAFTQHSTTRTALVKSSQPLFLSTRTDTNTQADLNDIPVEDANPWTDGMQLQKSFSYGDFAKNNPFVNNLLIATAKTASADFIAQTVIAQQPISEVDLSRTLLFCMYGLFYLGAFQYWYQVNIFKKLFDVDKFTNLTLEEKIEDIPGLKSLSAQIGIDLMFILFVNLPTFYILKGVIFSGSSDPAIWVSSGFNAYQASFMKDALDVFRVWFPADFVCFSVPLYLRLPVRHAVSFFWTTYLSFSRGGH